VLHIDPNNAEALGELEKLYEREKAVGKAAEVVRAPGGARPDVAARPRSCRSSAILYGEKLNDNRAAIDAWRRLLAVDAENKRAQDAVKKLYLTLKAWPELEQFFADQGKLDEYVRVLERQVETEDDATRSICGQDRPALPRQAGQVGSSHARVRARPRRRRPQRRRRRGADPAVRDGQGRQALRGCSRSSSNAPAIAASGASGCAAGRAVERELRDKGAAFGWC